MKILNFLRIALWALAALFFLGGLFAEPLDFSEESYYSYLDTIDVCTRGFVISVVFALGIEAARFAGRRAGIKG